MAAALTAALKFFPTPKHSPDLATPDVYLFQKLKTKLHGRRYGNNESVIEAVNEFFEDQIRKFYFEGLNKLDRLAKSALMKRAIILKSKIISWVL
jgi:hypothetical protein